MTGQLPEYFHPIDREKQFSFACHPGVACFTECCRQLDLALTPYDVLRLKKALGMSSDTFLEQYVIIEWDERVCFPQCYLTMIDDGRASCAFVSPEGCTVYPDRPGACRTYPVGRGAGQEANGRIKEYLVLIKEPHCLGFQKNIPHSLDDYFISQGLADYNRFNDALTAILHHEQIRKGYRPSRRQLEQYLLALYNLDMFRREMAAGRITMNRPLRADELQALAGDDEKLLLLGIAWLRQELFNDDTT
ncbi:MAG: YkgJ family cysteine cluster protein [Desulfobulbaceae bacterium]|nr:YkgJ family cysteine cluster protein [Desulfobulbaceae bacterium]